MVLVAPFLFLMILFALDAFRFMLEIIGDRANHVAYYRIGYGAGVPPISFRSSAHFLWVLHGFSGGNATERKLPGSLLSGNVPCLI